MKTPAGRECRYYYEDYHRGRSTQECRLLRGMPGPRWQPRDCRRCPVPDILWANASEHLRLTGAIQVTLLGLARRVEVEATCARHRTTIPDPYVGCPECAAEKPDLADVFDRDTNPS